MKLLSVLSLSLVLSCTTLSAQKVYEISAFGLKANSNSYAWPAARLRCRYAACLCRRLCPDVVLWRRRAEDQRVLWRVV